MSLTDVYEDYRAIAKDDLPRMQESTFQQMILPELLKKNRGDRPNYDFWIGVIGVPHREIIVQDQAGTELFRVPPILSRLPTDISTDTRISIAGLADLYQKRRSVENPVAVDLWFNQTVSKMSPEIHDEDMLRYLRNNMLIYARYKVPLSELLGEYSDVLVAKPLSEVDHTGAPTGVVSERTEKLNSVAPTASDYDFEEGGLHDL